MAIRIFTTGGTIDNLEYDSEDKAPKSPESYIPKLVKQAKTTIEIAIESIFAKDSKFVNDTDRAILYQRCLAVPEETIIITHGTMTMADTAQYLGRKNIPKTIILLGATIPAHHENSDALFNLGFAFSAVQLLPHGVYIGMNGRIFKGDNVTKNLKKGIFEQIF